MAFGGFVLGKKRQSVHNCMILGDTQSLPKGMDGKPNLESHKKSSWYEEDEFQTTMPKVARRSEVKEPKQQPDTKRYEAQCESSNPASTCHIASFQWYLMPPLKMGTTLQPSQVISRVGT